MIWCVYALWEYLRHTLRPKISMGWDIVFMVLWLALVICCAIGMVEADAWAHKMHYNPAQYTVFVVSSVTLYAIIPHSFSLPLHLLTPLKLIALSSCHPTSSGE